MDYPRPNIAGYSADASSEAAAVAGVNELVHAMTEIRRGLREGRMSFRDLSSPPPEFRLPAGNRLVDANESLQTISDRGTAGHESDSLSGDDEALLYDDSPTVPARVSLSGPDPLPQDDFAVGSEQAIARRIAAAAKAYGDSLHALDGWLPQSVHMNGRG